MWNLLTSHVSLSHLKQLSCQMQNAQTNSIQEFSSSLPESLPELSIFYPENDVDALKLATAFQIETFHSLRILSLFTLFYSDLDDSRTIAIIQLLERISPLSRRSLDRTNIYVGLMGKREIASFINSTKWTTVGEVIATFPSTPETIFHIEPVVFEEDTVPKLVNICRSGLPRARVVAESSCARCRDQLHEKDIQWPMFPDSKTSLLRWTS